MKPPRKQPFTQNGAAMLVALMFLFAGTIAITAWMHLMSARLRQSEAFTDEVQRHIVWGNTQAINQEYSYNYAFRDDVTRAANTTTLSNSWGGVSTAAYSNLKVLRSNQRSSNPTDSYPYNNIRQFPTLDKSVYYERTSTTSDTSQSEHLSIYNYHLSYPTTLLGDLLILHKKTNGGGAGTYNIMRNLRVDGRTVIWDNTAVISGVRSTSCVHRYNDATTTTLDNSGTNAILPDNYADFPITSSSPSTAVIDGTLNMLNNSSFPAGSLYAIMQAGIYTNYSSTANSGTATDPVQIKVESSPTYTPPATSPYNYSYTASAFKTIRIRPLVAGQTTSALTHCYVSAGFDQVIIEGQTNTTDYANAGNLSPIIIYMDSNSTQDIRFVGENNRRLILGVGAPGAAVKTIYMGFSGTTSGTTGFLRWRLQLINEGRDLYFAPPASGTANVMIFGGIRTNYSLNCTDATNTMRFALSRETTPIAPTIPVTTMETLMPRDAWYAPYFLVR